MAPGRLGLLAADEDPCCSHHAAYSTITLRHLASMSGGDLSMVRDVSPEQPWGDPIASLVPQPPRYESGTACADHDHDVFLQATTNQVPVSRRHATGADPGGHYGFYWWTNGRQRNGQSAWSAAPPRTYAARGASANVCFVVPEWNMVIARVAAVPDESKTSDQTWNTFFSKLGPAVASNP